MIFALLFYCLIVPAWSLDLVKPPEPNNNRPIIGILAQEISYSLNAAYPGKYDSYIAASYVKFVEGAGARAVPIWIGQDKEYYENILNKVNGVLWPGGSTFFNQSGGYADAGRTIYRIAKRLNQNGHYFPILGICLGFELLTFAAANGVEHRIDCSSKSQMLPLEFKPGFKNSKLFMNAPAFVIDILRSKNITANFHRYCVTEQNLARVNLNRKFRVVSVNHDVNNVKFISTVEHITYPFYGLQFHPEKNIYEWVIGKKIPHSTNAVQAARYFADFFINEARKNQHSFSCQEEELSSLIYNYPITYTGKKGSTFLQCYMFKK